MTMRRIGIIAAYALTGWALCGAVIAVGRPLMPLKIVLALHAVLAPLFFGVLSWHYHRRHNFTPPDVTGLIFLGVVVFMDVVLVALVIERSFAMFQSLLGTWIPFALIYLAVLASGRVANRSARHGR